MGRQASTRLTSSRASRRTSTGSSGGSAIRPTAAPVAFGVLTKRWPLREERTRMDRGGYAMAFKNMAVGASLSVLHPVCVDDPEVVQGGVKR